MYICVCNELRKEWKQWQKGNNYFIDKNTCKQHFHFQYLGVYLIISNINIFYIKRVKIISFRTNCEYSLSAVAFLHVAKEDFDE